jgi:hypothetical protein
MFPHNSKDMVGHTLSLWMHLWWKKAGDVKYTPLHQIPLTMGAEGCLDERNHMGLWLKWKEESLTVRGLPLQSGLPSDNVSQPHGCVWSAVNKGSFCLRDENHAHSGVGGKGNYVAGFSLTSQVGRKAIMMWNKLDHMQRECKNGLSRRQQVRYHISLAYSVTVG